MKKNPKDFQEKIISDIEGFKIKLETTGLQHTSRKAFAEIIDNYSRYVMDFYLNEEKEE